MQKIHGQTFDNYAALLQLMRDERREEARDYLRELARSYPAASLLDGPLETWCRGEYVMDDTALGLILYRRESSHPVLSEHEKARLEELFAVDVPCCVFMVVDQFLPDRHYRLAENIGYITIDGSPRDDFLSCLTHELAHAVYDAGNRLLNEGLAVHLERQVLSAPQRTREVQHLPVNLLSLLDTPLPYVEFHDLFPDLGEVYYQVAGDLVVEVLDKSGLKSPADFLQKWKATPGAIPSERLAALVDISKLSDEPSWKRSETWLSERLAARDFFREPRQSVEQFLGWANTLPVQDHPAQRDLALVLILLALASRHQLTRSQLEALRIHVTAFHHRLQLHEEDRAFVKLLGALLRISEAMDSRSPTQKRKKMEQANHELESLASHPKWGAEARRVLQHTNRRHQGQTGNTMNKNSAWASSAETLLQTGVARQLADYAGLNARIYDYRHVMTHDISFYLKHIPPKARVLELGCGTGRVTRPLLEHGMTVTGVDLSRDMLDLCRERLRSLNPRSYRLIQGDMTCVITEESYDAVIIPYSSFSLLESHQKRLETLNHIRGMLNPGATVYIDYEAPDPYVQVSPLGITHVSVFPSEQGSWMEVWQVKHDPVRNLKLQEISNFSLSRDGTYEVYVTKTAESFLSPSEVRFLVEQSGFEEKSCVRAYGQDPKSDYAIGNRFMTICVGRGSCLRS
jgi:ubiquinone/menaquinone biosynthesis C-methylase UbiE